jgi:hypothetical protein
MTDFSASASATGYLYQARYALWLLLGAEPDQQLTIEQLDDIAFMKGETPLQLIQTKHHLKSTASLIDTSVDIWKTLRIWSELLATGYLRPSETILTLVTTAKAPEGSAASKLRPLPSVKRDITEAQNILVRVATERKVKSNEQGYDAFLGLTSTQQRALISSIRVLDSSPDILDTKNEILAALRVSTRPKFLELVYERAEGWWFDKVINHLAGKTSSGISYKELLDKINDIQDEYRDDNLPIEFLRAIASEADALSDEERMFVEQLRLVAVKEPRIQHAINDYYRAYQQRSKWSREELLHCDELEVYEERLIDEWQRLHEIMKEDLGELPCDEVMEKEGRALFNSIEGMAIHIRPRCTQPFIMRGSYHILASKLRVGWHAQFLERLSKVLSSTGSKP